MEFKWAVILTFLLSMPLYQCIPGCCQTGALELGKWIHNYAFSKGLRDSIVVCTALIDMHAKCGNINSARELFYALPVRTVVSWTTMIAGFALNGNYKEALDLFCLMVDLDLKPNHLTFLAILQACTHAGLLEKGMEFFDMMKKVYKINPGVHHYFCMADLLGRKGRLEEATELVKSMLMKPDACIWGALLCACKIHRNVDIGEYACRHLFELEPQGAVPFVEMANIYASERRWDKVASLRTAMKFKKVKIFPGQSLLHINGRPSDCPTQGFRGYKVKTAIEEGSNFYGALVLTEDEFLDKFISRFRDDAEVLLVTYKAHLLDSTQEEDS